MTNDIRTYIKIIEQNLTEMPINKWDISKDFDHHANEVEKAGFSHWSNQDKDTILTQPRIERVKTAFQKCPFKINVLFYHLPTQTGANKGYDNAETYQGFGEISQKSTPLAKLPKNLKQAIKPFSEPDAINFVLTNNVAVDPVSISTGWMLAHRLGHAVTTESKYGGLMNIFGHYVRRLINFHYTENQKSQDMLEVYLAFAMLLGTMRSARMKITDYDEFFIDSIAQYIIQGKVKFNTAPNHVSLQDITKKPLSPKIRDSMKFDYTLKSAESANRVIGEMTEEMNNAIREILEDSVGKTFMD